MARHGPSHIRYVSTMTELDLLVKALAADLGDPSNWGAPVEFRDSLALCALNSAYSLQRKSVVVARLLARYRALRPSADTDSGLDLIQAMDDAGGPETFARDVLNNNSPLPGTRRLRTVGIYEALTRLAAPDVAVATAAQLRDAAEDPAAKKAWQSVSGLGPMSWSYLLIHGAALPDSCSRRRRQDQCRAGKAVACGRRGDSRGEAESSRPGRLAPRKSVQELALVAVPMWALEVSSAQVDTGKL